jgi:hypothetical protein
MKESSNAYRTVKLRIAFAMHFSVPKIFLAEAFLLSQK